MFASHRMHAHSETGTNTTTEFIISEPDDAPAGSEQSISEHSGSEHSYSNTFDDEDLTDNENEDIEDLERETENEIRNEAEILKDIKTDGMGHGRQQMPFDLENIEQIDHDDDEDGNGVYEEADSPNDDEHFTPTTSFYGPQQKERFLLTINKNVKTALDCIYHGFTQSKEHDCIGRKSGYSNDYEWYSYNQTVFKMHSFGSGLVHIGCQPSNNTMIVLYGRNNFKSMIAEFGAYHYSMVPVPIYDSCKSATFLEILHQVRPVVIVTDSNERAKHIMSLYQSEELHSIIITSENIHPETEAFARDKELKLYPFTEVERIGAIYPAPVNLAKPRDLAIVCFTSGTCGIPRGVLLTHANLVANVSAVLLEMNKYIDLKHETLVSYSSIAHARERIMKLCMFYCGGRVGVYFGDFKDLSRDLPVLQPTIMVCVPRILNRIYHRVITKVKSNWVKSRVLDVALRSKNPEQLSNVYSSENLKSSIWDKLVFKTVKQYFGGKLRLLVSSSNQISTIVLNFMKTSLGCPVIQSYDITECTSVVTCTQFNDQSPKHLGVPIACNSLKLVDVPEFNIITNDTGIGEICIKGTNVFSGYLGAYDAYRKTMDKDGWFHTGDIGQWLPNGSLKYIDRKENLSFVANPYGKLIAPNMIENIYIQSIFVGQCYVDVDFERGYLIAIIVPDIDGINLWCSENNMLLSAAEACRNVAFKNRLFSDIIDIGKREGLQEYEQVADVYLHSDSFTQEAGFLTPTMKLRRHEVSQYFRKEIEDIVNNKINGSTRG